MRKLIAGVLMGVLSALAFASAAFAASQRPRGEYAQFNECPIGPDEIDGCTSCTQASFGGVNEIHESPNKPIKRGTAESAPLTWQFVLGNNCYIGSNSTPVNQTVLFEIASRGSSGIAHPPNSTNSAERGAESNDQPDEFCDAAQLNRSPHRGR